MPKKEGIRFNTHSVEDIERVCNMVFPCKVQSRGYEIHKEGHHTVTIIVGKKLNPAYAPDHGDPKLRKNKKEIPDERVIHISGGMTEEALIVKIQNIKKTLPDPDMRDIPKITDRDITGIEAPEPLPPPLMEQLPDQPLQVKTEKEHDTDLKNTEENDKQEDQITDTLLTIVDKLDDMDKRMNKLEGSKVKTGIKKSSSKSQIPSKSGSAT